MFSIAGILALWVLKLFTSKQKNAPESMGAEWTGSGGEAGDFVELNAGGGIIGFHITSRDGGMCFLQWIEIYLLTFVHKLVFIRTDLHGFWSPSTQLLITMREKGYALFSPGSMDMRPMLHPPVILPLLASSTLTELGSRSRLFFHWLLLCNY